MTKTFFFLFLLTVNSIWALHCADPQNVAFSESDCGSWIEVKGNDEGVFCVGWVCDIKGDEYLQIAHKYPEGNWSEPSTLSTRDSNREIMKFEMKIGDDGSIYSLWEMNWDKECISSIFYAEKPYDRTWSTSTCLLKDIYEYPISLGVTKKGEAHILSDRFPQIQAHSFNRGRPSSNSVLGSPRRQAPLRIQLLVDNMDNAICYWEDSINDEIEFKYSQSIEGFWPEERSVKFANLSERTQFRAMGSLEDLAIIQYPFIMDKGHLIAISNKFLSNPHKFGKETDKVGRVKYSTDDEGNICLVWEIQRGFNRGIGIAFKPTKQDWAIPLELFPEEGREYLNPNVARGFGGNFIIIWEHESEESRPIVGAIFDAKNNALGEKKYLSPSEGDYSMPSLYFSGNGTGYIGWIKEVENNQILQVAELFL